MNTGMNIGTVVNKESLVPLTDAIVRIMESRADQRTIRAGLKALVDTARVEGVTIQNCVVKGDRSVTLNMDEADLEQVPSA